LKAIKLSLQLEEEDDDEEVLLKKAIAMSLDDD